MTDRMARVIDILIHYFLRARHCDCFYRCNCQDFKYKAPSSLCRVLRLDHKRNALARTAFHHILWAAQYRNNFECNDIGHHRLYAQRRGLQLRNNKGSHTVRIQGAVGSCPRPRHVKRTSAYACHTSTSRQGCSTAFGQFLYQPGKGYITGGSNNRDGDVSGCTADYGAHL